MASPEFKAFYQAVLERNRQSAPANQSMPEIREGFEKALADCPPDEDIAFHSFQIGKLPLLRCAAPNAHSDRAIVFFHAGGYNAGSNFSHRDLMGRLSRSSKAVVIGVDYRLAPEYPFPAALDDAAQAYAYCLREYPRLVLGGISAGGGLILSLMFLLKKKKQPLPLGGICLSPWVDLAMKGKSLDAHNGQDLISKARLADSADFYCGSHLRTDPLISPLYGDLSGLPPLLIQVGAREVLLDEIVQLAEKAKQQHVQTEFSIWPEMTHGWPLFSKKLPEGREALEAAGRFAAMLFDSCSNRSTEQKQKSR